MTLARPIAATAAALLLLAGCTSPDNTPADTAPSSSSTSPNTAPTTKTPTLAPPAADVTVTVVLKDGKVTPNGANVRVEDGQKVRISLDSDVGESIHVHGYDKTVEVQPGKTHQVTFIADQKGVFEVETHESEKLVAKLIVS